MASKTATKTKTLYSCTNCGQSSSKWLGRCPTCEQWNTIVEETVTAEPASSRVDRDLLSELAGTAGHAQPGWVPLDPKDAPSQDSNTEGRTQRISTGIKELDRVLGGGMVRDSFVLLGGEPGIGKSTLLLQAARGLIAQNPELKLLYASGEESIEQIRSRAKRLGVAGERRMFLAAETTLERVFTAVKEIKPQVLVIDSVQTFATAAVDSAPGSVSQVREVAGRLMALAKSAGVCVWLVGHVTKEGAIAGPKVVEHMVDTVLYFEAESGQSFRLLRAVKNRFGSSQELGIFEMDSEGLREVDNPSALFLGERTEAVSGTAVCASIEGSRPLLIELQALVTPSGLAIPRRTSVGMDTNRVALIAAILEKHLKIKLAENDLFFNVAGGLRLSEPACDLASAAAIWSSQEGIALSRLCIFIGELGLTGEVRRVSQPELRVEEAIKLGFKTIVLPKLNMDRVQKKLGAERIGKSSGVKLIGISQIRELPQAVNSTGELLTSSKERPRQPISQMDH